MDDIIFLLPDQHRHVSDIETILRTFEIAGMRVSPEKSKSIKTDVQFLGFIVTRVGIKVK